ncbi:hypothetical protein Cgig2_020582 [Carnegiea gigantea]|uniref:START domain-containing protein n=1 Tax=Carnegiea gigantea TaxID=171969 RepID=A0A9Q1JVW7_9CARY|nr:hypothetical protein Cgig2_020582 [Carnegiea gigantea]
MRRTEARASARFPPSPRFTSTEAPLASPRASPPNLNCDGAAASTDGFGKEIPGSLLPGTDHLLYRWDFSFYRGNVVEHLDGHTDIIHKQLFSNWLPWGMKRRDLLLRRYWRRDDDGTYGIYYSPDLKFLFLLGGGYVITPVNHGKQSVVKHMLAIDWKYWKAYLLSSSARSITIRMLERVAALRELFRAKAGDYSSDFLLGNMLFCNEAHTENRPEFQTFCESREGKVDEKELDKSEHGSLVGLDDVSDEFYDVPEQSDYDMEDEGWPSDCGQGACLQVKAVLFLPQECPVISE